jgi:glycosyltransferase involved in cell wall biosynthesis/GT2 family glycosyltransferase
VEALFAEGVDVRLRASDAIIEDMKEFLSIRRFLHDKPDAPFAAVAMDRFPADLRDSQFSAVISVCDNFACFSPVVVGAWNRLDAVVTYSKFSANVMRERGCQRVHVMPLGVDSRRFYPERVPRAFVLPPSAFIRFNHKATALRPEGIINEHLFVFFIAGMMQHRKAAEETIRAFNKAFNHDDSVLLWIHGRKDWWGRQDALDVMAECAGGAHSPAMLWTDGIVSDDDLRRMLCRADCYLSTHKLEGFGLMPLQAMACGTPCIITAYSGPMDYATEYNSFLLPAREVDAQRETIPAGVHWGEWEEDDLVDLMRHVVDTPSERKSRIQAGLSTARQWTWGRSAKSLIDVVEGNVSIGRRVKPKADGSCAILIPVRDGLSDIDRMIQSLYRVDAGYKFSVWICDDGSRDGTYEMMLRQYTPLGIRVLRNNEPAGCPFTRNRLFAESADSEWCFICDCDLEFIQEMWLKSLIRLHTASLSGITAPLLIYPDGRVQSAGGMLDTEGIPCLHRFHHCEVSKEVLTPCEVEYAPSAAWLLRRELIDEIGGFLEDYAPTYYDDVDFCRNVRRIGKSIRYEPSVRIIHHEGSFHRQYPHADWLQKNRKLFKFFWNDTKSKT